MDRWLISLTYFTGMDSCRICDPLVGLALYDELERSGAARLHRPK